MRVLVCGWIGSTNLGDELVFAGVRSLLQGRARVLAVSIDPAVTTQQHGVPAIDHRRVDLVAAAARRADLVVLGGGGLVQDETSPLNLPYHLSRAWLARLGGTPWVGLALGVGPLSTLAGRQLAKSLRSAQAITVRDEPSLSLLEQIGVRSELAADAAYHLASSTGRSVGGFVGGRTGGPAGDDADASDAGDAIVVALRPWSGGGGLMPVGWRSTDPEPPWFVPTVAASLERASRRSGLPVRFVALQTDRDHALHQRVAAAMAAPTETLRPTRQSVLHELARGRVVVAMRYHAGVGATLAGRPSVLIGYSPKVDALAATLGSGAAYLPFDAAALSTIDDAVVRQLESDTAAGAVRAATQRLRSRADVNARMLERFLA